MNKLYNLIYSNKIKKETFWAFLAKFVSAISGLFFLLFIPIFAGIEEYGFFMLFFAYIFLAGPFFGNSLNEAVKKEVTIYKFNEK
ncbi:MAG: hypothetical protein PHN56_05790 [Candidatus Nanoarchaeia archaeon]|nr:hypothetical protein [Candidatus Nanoarchaeia archaeon]